MNSDRWIYSAWFRNVTLDASEQDYEWVAVLEIQAETAPLAKQWGDHLAQRRVKLDPSNEFLGSDVLSPKDPLYANATMHSIPSVSFGAEATDAQLGW
jgi:hypothetical protein